MQFSNIELLTFLCIAEHTNSAYLDLGFVEKSKNHQVFSLNSDIRVNVIFAGHFGVKDRLGIISNRD